MTGKQPGSETVVPGPPFQKCNCPKMYADFKLKRVINNEKYITGSPIANLVCLSQSPSPSQLMSLMFSVLLFWSGTSLIGAGIATSAALIYYVI